jgi:hypothetical protein
VPRLGWLALLALSACAHAGAVAAGTQPAGLVLLYTGDGRGAVTPCG